MKILIIIPAYNEDANIVSVCCSIYEFNKKTDIHADYVVINDGSKDNTGNICKQNKIPCIDLISNLGIGGAVQTGYLYAYNNNYDIAVQFDGDGQHDINYLPHLIEPIINKKANRVIGSRYIENLSKFKSTIMRRIGSKILSLTLKFSTGQKIYDITSGFRAIDKNIMKIFKDNYPNDYPEPESLVEVIKNNYVIKEIPVKMNERKRGKSSITPIKSIYYMLKVSYAIIVSSIVFRRQV